MKPLGGFFVLVALVPFGARAAAPEPEVIDDPLLAPTSRSGPHAPPSVPKESPSSSDAASAPSIFHALVLGRLSTQTSWNDLPGGKKEVVDLRLRALLSASDASHPRFGWKLGVLFDEWSHAPRGDRHLLGAASHTFEARPWEAYVDGAIGDHLRVRIGNQTIAWGKLDLFSAADVLSARDLRQGPVPDLDLFRIPTPSAVLTWTPSDALELRAGFTPFFTPDRFDVSGSNYAAVGPNAIVSPAPFARIMSQLDPSTRERVNGDLASIDGPSARPDEGEAAARGVWRAGAADVALTYGFVRSKVPAIRVATPLLALLSPSNLRSAAAANAEVTAALAEGQHLVEATYARYHQLAADVEVPWRAWTFSGELGYSPSRPLFYVAKATTLPTLAMAPFAQGGARAVYAKDEDFSASLEANALVVITRPKDDAGGTALLYGFGNRRFLFAGVATLRELLGRHALELAALPTSSGPSLAIVPRYGFHVAEPLLVGAGAALFAGPRAGVATISTWQRGLDQIFLFADWRP